MNSVPSSALQLMKQYACLVCIVFIVSDLTTFAVFCCSDATESCYETSHVNVANPEVGTGGEDIMASQERKHDDDVDCQTSRTYDDVRSPKSSESQNMALVVYNPTQIAPFKLNSRNFTFAGKHISIKQDWGNLGVAAVVWEAAIVLCEYLEKSVKESSLQLTNQRVIELGAGTGLVGMIAAVLGGDVIITDRKMALGQLQENVDENFKTTEKHLRNRIHVQELHWGQNLQEYPRPFDLVLGADIIYIKETFPDLLKTLIHLSDCDTVILLSCKIRYEKDSNFVESLKEYFQVMEVRYDADRDVRIFKAIKLCDS
ncbi:protein N-lysine methyltransferase METTL21A-like [Ptychodera flava]|uniref:protein N-lysine methyltransferase METTL21A-like n=1 Tax=Ptychodera flava TaxID=63121 RepID=UPI003969F064